MPTGLYESIIRGGGGGSLYGGGGATPSAYAGMANVYPNLSQLTSQASENILNEMKGQLSPMTLQAMQDQAARSGITMGMPGAPISQRVGMALVGKTTEGLRGQGMQDFLNTLRSYAGTIAPTTGELIGQQTAREGLSAQQSMAAADLAERRRQFDISEWLRNQQFYAGLGPSYMQAAGSYLNWL